MCTWHPAGTAPPNHVTGPLFRSGYFADSLPTPFPTDPNGLISILELDLSGAPQTQAQITSDLVAQFPLPHRLPAQIIIDSRSATVVDNALAINAHGIWTAPDLASTGFSYSVNLNLVPSMQMHPDTSQVLELIPYNSGSLSFDFPPNDPFFRNTMDAVVLTVLAPFFVDTVTADLVRNLDARIQRQILDRAAGFFGSPAGSPLPAGVVLSLERVRIQAQATNEAPAGISFVAALGSLGPLKNKFPASTGGGTTCLLTFLAASSFLGPATDLTKYRLLRNRMSTNAAGRALVRAYYFFSGLIVPWLARAMTGNQGLS